jgi:hypothetical protein
MRFDPQAGVTKTDGPKASRRRFGRLPQDTLMCNVGAVVDISAGGMRILCTHNPPERVHIRLEGYDLPGPLMAELAWSKRARLFSRERLVGMRFVNLTPELAKCLTDIAGTNRFRRAI